jgi:hypothetical protein
LNEEELGKIKTYIKSHKSYLKKQSNLTSSIDGQLTAMEEV